MAFFSVVIPLYNKELFIEQTISSLLKQSFTDFDVIIVNDGSTDSSLEKLSPLVDDRFKIINQENKGASYTRNLGINESTGNYIALLDADDYWHPNHLLELKKLIEEFPNAGLYCNNYEIKLNENFIKKASLNFKFSDECIIISDFFDANIFGFVATSSSVAFLKTSFKKTGAYDLRLRTGQDIDLWIRFALNYDIAFNPKITMMYNNFDNLSLSNSKFNADRYLLVNKYQEEEKTNISLKKYLDINRYAIAIRCILNNEKRLYNKLKSEIDNNNLNFKQKALINSPKLVLELSKKIHSKLIKYGFYYSANS